MIGRTWTLATAVLALGACDGYISGPEISPPAGPANLHRLTNRQYQNTVRDLLGADIAVPTSLESDAKLHGFTSIATGELTVSPIAAEKYELAARDLAHQVVADPARRAALIPCETADDQECMRTFFSGFAGRAWRRPIEPAEVDEILAVVATAAGSIGDPWTGIEYGLATVLQSPHFLYRVEVGHPDPQYPARLQLDGYEVAARLSYLLWDTTPDDDLLAAAERGDLDDAAGVAAAAERLIASPRARDALASFFAEYLNLERLDTITKDATLFPEMTPELIVGMRGELQRLFLHIALDEDVDYRQILTSPVTFVNPQLAAFYGVDPPTEPAEPTANDFVQRELDPASGRGGLLTSAGLLALYAHNTSTSPTLRGRFVRQNLLCEDIPPPPPGVDTSLTNVTGPTLRDKLEAHRENPVCAACHDKMDPIGLGFESFDAIGAFRTEELPGIPVDASGDLDGVEFVGPAELAALLAEDPRVGPCFARQLYRFATGHLETESEGALIDHLSWRFGKDGFRVKQLMLDLVASDGFRYAALPENAPIDSTEEP